MLLALVWPVSSYNAFTAASASKQRLPLARQIEEVQTPEAVLLPYIAYFKLGIDGYPRSPVCGWEPKMGPRTLFFEVCVGCT